MQGIAFVGATPPSRSSLADHIPSPRGRGSYTVQDMPFVGATPPSRSSLADHIPSPRGWGSYTVQDMPAARYFIKLDSIRLDQTIHHLNGLVAAPAQLGVVRDQQDRGALLLVDAAQERKHRIRALGV